MPIALPNLDDRTFADLTAELRGLIPRYARQWTNHNPSDPGITILELLAWLAEMVIYRLNRIPERSYLVLLGLMGIEPAAAQVEVTFGLHIAQNTLPQGFEIPRATRVAAIDAVSGEEIIFETLAPTAATEGRWDAELDCWRFKSMAVNTIEVEGELIGASNGTAHQEFALGNLPVFLNRDDPTDARNPAVVGKTTGAADTVWTYRRDLLDARPDEPVFTVDQLPGLVRFGGGDSGGGLIPASGTRLFCTYHKLGGTRGNVAAGRIVRLKDALPGVDPSRVTVTNEYPATGGVDAEGLEALLTRGLLRMQERYRAVSAADFEYLAGQAAPGRIARVKAVFDRNLERSTSTGEGHVSLIVLPDRAYLGGPRSCAEVRTALALSKVGWLHQDILAFLEDRRLITTVLHAVNPEFSQINLEITVQARPGKNPVDLASTVEEAVREFLDPYDGGEQREGWPFGRDVHRSELYQLIEGLDGVDHVQQMKMNGDVVVSSVAVSEDNLVCLQSLTVTVT
ncbi:MAG: putative baseplate assembly protein [Desulfobacterales bacterium]|nr:MAG: putative baseplate assembly protein [Desulfobacterales bacterium]